MTCNRTLLLAAALALAGAGCTKKTSNTPGIRFRQPASVAVFQGRTTRAGIPDAPDAPVRPYLAVANSARNDVSLVDAETDAAVLAPIQLRTLVLPVSDRPSLLAAASLGDDTADVRKADLLVAVSAGDSVLQVVETWDAKNAVRSDPDPNKAGRLAVDVGHDILAITAVPSLPGRARIAMALADALIAVVEYRRGDDGQSIAFVSSNVTPPLPFQPASIAAMPDDGDPANGIQTKLYVATRDELVPGSGIFGVAELSPDDLTAPPRALGARAPTRLVAAIRLQERNNDPLDPAARYAANDASAFQRLNAGVVEPMPVVERVYAVLDDSGCGPTKPIDCGVVALDPAATTTVAIPPDYAGLIPYRAPMRLPGRPLALAVSGPPEKVPEVAGEPSYAGYMRLYMGTIPRVTSAVAAVASDGGGVYFLDLGRFETATIAPAIAVRSPGSPSASDVSPDPSRTDVPKDRRLWIQTPQITKMDGSVIADGAFASETDSVELNAAVTTTPGFTTDETWDITWQGYVTKELSDRIGEVGQVQGTSDLWLALQLGDGPAGGARTFTQVVRLWHPAMGVQEGDILVVKARETATAPQLIPGCDGKAPPAAPGSNPAPEFELGVGPLLPPSVEHPGGAVTIVPPAAGAPAEWGACYTALSAAVGANSGLVTRLRVSVRAQGLVMVGNNLGYAGRPPLGSVPDPADPSTGRKPFALAYPSDPASNEDALAAACPLADWDGSYPVDPAVELAVLNCGGTCDRSVCERLVLARKARRFHNLSVNCSTDPNDSTCATGTSTLPARWPPSEYPFPFVNGPAIGFSVAVQYHLQNTPSPATNLPPVRDMKLTLAPQSGVYPSAARATGTSPYQASGAVPFDRTRWTDGAAGYRFFVSYPADFVLDTSPSQAGSPTVPSNVLR